PLNLVHVPQLAWLLLCSLTFLILGLVLYFTPLPTPVFWGVLIVAALAILAVGILWPSTLAAVAYGCEPGVPILLLVVGLQWMVQRSYRRQVVFMPGFSRLKPGSSLVRTG